MQIHFNYFGRGYHRLKMKYTPVYYIVLEKKTLLMFSVITTQTFSFI